MYQISETCTPYTHRSDRPQITGPADMAPLLAPYAGIAQEVFFVALLDARYRVIELGAVTIGTANSSLVHPRDVYRRAVERNAVAVLVAHNHPSGDPTPSADDIALTRRLTLAGDIIGITLLDHLIIGDETVSLREANADAFTRSE